MVCLHVAVTISSFEKSRVTRDTLGDILGITREVREGVLLGIM